MSALRNYINKIKPNFQEGGKLHAFRSVFDGFETFLYVPNETAKSGTNIHDAIDSKRIMSFVVIALLPALLFGMYNIGYQNYAAAGTLETAGFIEIFVYGFLAAVYLFPACFGKFYVAAEKHPPSGYDLPCVVKEVFVHQVIH